MDHAPEMWNLGRAFEPSIGVAANDSIVFNRCGKAEKCVHLKASVDLAEY